MHQQRRGDLTIRLGKALAGLVVAWRLFSPAVAGPAVEEGFEPLCNGHDLEGWVAMEGGNFDVRDGMIVCTGRSNWPSWLRTAEQYENFIVRLEYKTYYGAESGIYFSAPRAGRVANIGFEYQINGTGHLTPYSTGGIVGTSAPLAEATNGSSDQEFQRLEIRLNWPQLEVRLNGQLVQDVNCEEHPLLRYKQRVGHLGFACRGKRVDFRNVRVKRLPDQVTDEWQPMLNGVDLDGWTISDRCSARWEIDSQGVLTSADGHGYLVSDDEFYNCEWKCFIQPTPLANGGVFFDWVPGDGRGFEIQIEDILDSNDPTGSIYGRVRASQLPRKQGDWSLMHVIVQDRTCVVRVDGTTVAESTTMNRRRWGRISLQMHRRRETIQWKDMMIRRLPSPEK